MSRSKVRAFLMLSLLGASCLLGGCGGNSNEAEYLRTTSPGTPAEPESVASRRDRTKVAPTKAGKGAKSKSGTGSH